VNNTDVETPNPGLKPKLDITANLSLRFDWLNVVLGVFTFRALYVVTYIHYYCNVMCFKT